MLKIIAYINKEDIEIQYDYDLSELHSVNAYKIIKSNYDNGTLLDMTYATTHKHVLNIVGKMIEEGKVKSDDVIVLMVERDEVTECGFDSEGYMIKGWKYGFLDSCFE